MTFLKTFFIAMMGFACFTPLQAKEQKETAFKKRLSLEDPKTNYKTSWDGEKFGEENDKWKKVFFGGSRLELNLQKGYSFGIPFGIKGTLEDKKIDCLFGLDFAVKTSKYVSSIGIKGALDDKNNFVYMEYKDGEKGAPTKIGAQAFVDYESSNLGFDGKGRLAIGGIKDDESKLAAEFLFSGDREFKDVKFATLNCKVSGSAKATYKSELDMDSIKDFSNNLGYKVSLGTQGEYNILAPWHFFNSTYVNFGVSGGYEAKKEKGSGKIIGDGGDTAGSTSFKDKSTIDVKLPATISTSANLMDNVKLSFEGGVKYVLYEKIDDKDSVFGTKKFNPALEVAVDFDF